jgi:hypothetical protein
LSEHTVPSAPDLPPQARLTWPDAGAAGYRVQIHDADTKEVVADERVDGTTYTVDWSRLDHRRRLRYRVLVRDTIKWREVVGLQTLHPPVELLEGMEPGAPGPEVSLTHLVLTRFSIRSSGVGYRNQWDDAWFDRRLELFERYCLPSMVAQTSKAFTWVVFCDPTTPEAVVERLRGYSEHIVVAECRRHASVRGKAPDDLMALDEFVDPDSEVVITTRLDSDDALNRCSVEQIQRHATAFSRSGGDFLLHTFPLGCKLDAVDGRVYRTWYRQNAFLSLFERAGTDPKGVMQDNHVKLETRFSPLERDFSLLGWLQVLHGSNVSNALNRHDEEAHGLDLRALYGLEGSSARDHIAAGGSASASPARTSG